jgi:hypothetical protein
LQFHLGVEFADGRRADCRTHWISINRPTMSNRMVLPSDPLTEISLRAGGASAHDRRYSGSAWAWPPEDRVVPNSCTSGTSSGRCPSEASDSSARGPTSASRRNQ